MVVWGGRLDGPLTYYNDGAQYDPAEDAWRPTGTENAPAARTQHTAAWTGSEMLVFGGYNGTSYFDSLHAYTPARTLTLYVKP